MAIRMTRQQLPYLLLFVSVISWMGTIETGEGIWFSIVFTIATVASYWARNR